MGFLLLFIIETWISVSYEGVTTESKHCHPKSWLMPSMDEEVEPELQGLLGQRKLEQQGQHEQGVQHELCDLYTKGKDGEQLHGQQEQHMHMTYPPLHGQFQRHKT